MIRRSLEMRLKKLERRGPRLRRQGKRPLPDWLQRHLEAQGYRFDTEGRILRGTSGAAIQGDGPLTGRLKVDRAGS